LDTPFAACCHNPGFTVRALLTMAPGTGVNTAVLNIVNAVLRKPSRIWTPDGWCGSIGSQGPALYNVSYPNLRDWQTRLLTWIRSSCQVGRAWLPPADATARSFPIADDPPSFRLASLKAMPPQSNTL
jgi:hypothetical protein